ncbi:MAG TPA: Grx4 family monothiol glutaredoxin [Candidatus Gracilibacteria bacterium]|nr:Grx4 family monothiol glutaredoxin [Candidatus Gracilibacteria bacterium]
MDTNKKIEQLINGSRIFIFMKGEPDQPMCGFSALAIAVLKRLKVEFDSCNVLTDPQMRQGIKEYSNWPTIPQVYVDGKFIGGSDILQELYQSGELQKMVAQK